MRFTFAGVSAGLDDETGGRELAVMVRDRGEQLQPLPGLKRSHEEDVHTVYLSDHKRQRLECVEVLKEDVSCGMSLYTCIWHMFSCVLVPHILSLHFSI